MDAYIKYMLKWLQEAGTLEVVALERAAWPSAAAAANARMDGVVPRYELHLPLTHGHCLSNAHRGCVAQFLYQEYMCYHLAMSYAYLQVCVEMAMRGVSAVMAAARAAWPSATAVANARMNGVAPRYALSAA